MRALRCLPNAGTQNEITKGSTMTDDDDGRLVTALEFERGGEVVHVMKLKPPVGEFSRRLERVERGILINMADDALFFEIGEDGERLR